MKKGETPGGVRIPLKNVLPLDMPMLIQMFPAYACNLRCEFCLHGLPKSEHGFISDAMLMDMKLYEKVIADIRNSGKKVKMLRFAAIGEPLIHPEIAKMVKFAKDNNAAESIDIVTNGVLLTHELSDKLLDAGLSRLRISVEGLSDKDYGERCHASVRFDDLVDELTYFYSQKTKLGKSTEVYIKIIDYMVQKEEEREKFFSIFSPISDSIAIEHLTPTIHEIDYQKVSKGMALDKGHNEERLLKAEICPQPFYMMQINPDGKVVPCCSMRYPAVLGDVNNETVQECWNGEKYNKFRLDLLTSRTEAGEACEKCNLFLYDLHEADILDDVRDELMKKYSMR